MSGADLGDTIFALATAPGKAGVAVIRVSGPRSHDAARTLAGPGISGRGMWVRPLRFESPSDAAGTGAGRDSWRARDGGGTSNGDSASADLRGTIDDALVLAFAAPASFTGEDVVEFQIHGSMATVSAVLGALAELDGLRPAEPGEFTRRALENGKMDVVQVEGLADLIDAETEAQRIQARRLLEGELGRLADRWRQALVRAMALLEATIDFADEDVPTDVTSEVNDLLTEVESGLARELDGAGMAERIRHGFEVAIVGSPNVGKSTLLNALVGRQAVITSTVAGTTRDVIEARMELDGMPVTVLDMAGLRETSDEIEKEGVARARVRAEEADLRVFLVEGGRLPEGVSPRGNDLVLRAKSDLLDAADEAAGLVLADGSGFSVTGAVSGLTGAGVDELVGQLSSRLSDMCAAAGLASRARHVTSMKTAHTCLEAAKSVLGRGPDSYELAAEELRGAIRSLEILTGRVDVEAYLDEIFASFCLGK